MVQRVIMPRLSRQHNTTSSTVGQAAASYLWKNWCKPIGFEVVCVEGLVARVYFVFCFLRYTRQCHGQARPPSMSHNICCSTTRRDAAAAGSRRGSDSYAARLYGLLVSNLQPHLE